MDETHFSVFMGLLLLHLLEHVLEPTDVRVLGAFHSNLDP